MKSRLTEGLFVQTSSIGLGTIQPGDSLVFDMVASVVAPSTGATMLTEFSWSSPGGRIDETHTFEVPAQRGDVDWSSVELTEPYSLEPVATENDLIGRKAELDPLASTGQQPDRGVWVYFRTEAGRQNVIG